MVIIHVFNRKAFHLHNVYRAFKYLIKDDNKQPCLSFIQIYQQKQFKYTKKDGSVHGNQKRPNHIGQTVYSPPRHVRGTSHKML